MKQKIINILNQYGIYYTEEGANVKKGHINIACPWCGNADPSEHMGIDPKRRVYGCWRNSNHRGKDLARLFQALCHISYSEAKLFVDVDKIIVQGENFLSQVEGTLTLQDENIVQRLGGVTKLGFLDSFKNIQNDGVRKKFYDYLKARGFKDTIRLDELLIRHWAQCSLVGEYKFRIIFPIYYQKQLVTWTSRSIHETAILRYKDLSIEESVRHIKYCLYDYDRLLLGGKKLFITEGPLDKWMLDYHFMNIDEGYKVTCIFTISMQEEQVYLLTQVSKKFDSVILLLDKGVESQMLGLKNKLGFIKNLWFMYLPEGVSDPGELNEEQVRRLL